MFEDRESVLNLITELFREHYGELDGGVKVNHRKEKDDVPKSDQSSSGFDLLMARRSAAKPHAQVIDSNDPPSATTASEELPQRRNLLEPTITSSHSPENEEGHISGGSNGVRTKRPGIVNPESISRINASFRTPRRENPHHINPGSGTQLSESLMRPMTRYGELFPDRLSPHSPELPSPPTTRHTLGSPISQRREQLHGPSSSSPEINRRPSFRRADRERDRERYGNGALDTWFQRTTQVSLEKNPATHSVPSREPSEVPLSSLAEQRFGISQNLSQGDADDNQQNATRSPSSEGSSPRQPTPNQPSTLDNHHDEIPFSMDSGRGFPVLERWAAQLHEDGAHSEPTDLEKALDFEKRKKEAVRARRLQVQNGERSSGSQPAQIPPSSQNSRYLAAKAALTSTEPSIAEPVFMSKIAPHDPRAYLMRQQKSPSANEPPLNGVKVQRSLTSRLPFERIPDGLDLHSLAVSCSVDLAPNFFSFDPCSREDSYIRSGHESTAFSSSEAKECLPLWNERLGRIMREQYESRDDSQPPRGGIDFSSIIDEHIDSFSEK